MRDRVSHKNRRGVLLVEALVAFALFLIASVALFGLMANTRRAESKARQSLAANAYARQLMEGCRLKGYSGLTVGTTKGTKSFSTYEVDSALVKGKKVSTSTLEGATKMSYTVTVYEGPGTGVRSIVVNVTWYQGFVTLESYVTQ
jgi:Tfp pilus assembly protein PilV